MTSSCDLRTHARSLQRALTACPARERTSCSDAPRRTTSHHVATRRTTSHHVAPPAEPPAAESRTICKRTAPARYEPCITTHVAAALCIDLSVGKCDEYVCIVVYNSISRHPPCERTFHVSDKCSHLTKQHAGDVMPDCSGVSGTSHVKP